MGSDQILHCIKICLWLQTTDSKVTLDFTSLQSSLLLEMKSHHRSFKYGETLLPKMYFISGQGAIFIN